jgi:hypothetical protein
MAPSATPHGKKDIRQDLQDKQDRRSTRLSDLSLSFSENSKDKSNSLILYDIAVSVPRQD